MRLCQSDHHRTVQWAGNVICCSLAKGLSTFVFIYQKKMGAFMLLKICPRDGVDHNPYKPLHSSFAPHIKTWITILWIKCHLCTSNWNNITSLHSVCIPSQHLKPNFYSYSSNGLYYTAPRFVRLFHVTLPISVSLILALSISLCRISFTYASSFLVSRWMTFVTCLIVPFLLILMKS